MIKQKILKNLTVIQGVGKSIAEDLWDIEIREVSDLIDKSPEMLYEISNQVNGAVQDKCLLYVFRCAVYYAGTPIPKQDPQRLKWWNRKTK